MSNAAKGEALPSCRGRRARHAHKECTGSWEIPRLAKGDTTPWSASGRRGAEADDARTREVGLRHSSYEADEQGHPPRAGGAKGGDQGNADQQSTRRAQDRESVSALERIRQAARQRKKERFTTLLHHISIELLRLSYFELKKDAAAGVDGLTWRDYGADLEGNLEGLHGRVQRGAYRALPSRRQHTEAGRTTAPNRDSRTRRQDRPESDRAAVLSAIYEGDFLGFSYMEFRPKRSQHDALDALVVGISSTKVNWILEVDVRSFFDEVSQEWLVRSSEHWIADPHHPPDPRNG